MKRLAILCLPLAGCATIPDAVTQGVDLTVAACRGIMAENPARDDKIGQVCRKVLEVAGD